MAKLRCESCRAEEYVPPADFDYLSEDRCISCGGKVPKHWLSSSGKCRPAPKRANNANKKGHRVRWAGELENVCEFYRTSPPATSEREKMVQRLKRSLKDLRKTGFAHFLLIFLLFDAWRIISACYAAPAVLPLMLQPKQNQRFDVEVSIMHFVAMASVCLVYSPLASADAFSVPESAKTARVAKAESSKKANSVLARLTSLLYCLFALRSGVADSQSSLTMDLPQEPMRRAEAPLDPASPSPHSPKRERA
jgi:hypothetical protein